ncbi:MAG: sulfite exporter TauE/SafE family protein [Chthoniobacterales bacterium]|nr:sulfite exporter TauE/SafE family protein [Chthoniobacterales bacterium]
MIDLSTAAIELVDAGSFLLALGMMGIAALYASVGHGGASGYLAAMAIASVPPPQMRPTALILNLAVSVVGTMAFVRAGYVRSKVFVPLVVMAVPMAYLGGGMKLPPGVFHGLLAVGLTLAGVRLFYAPRQRAKLCEPTVPVLMVVGGLLGFVSGLIGVGGGIFLTPLLILLGWADARTAAGISAPFIFVNSAAGLAGLCKAGDVHVLPEWPLFLICVLVGGSFGATWGSGRAPDLRLRQALGAVLAAAVVKLFLVAVGHA